MLYIIKCAIISHSNRGVRVVEHNGFILFGMGPLRRKMVYCPGGRLLDAMTLETILDFEPAEESIAAHEYRVRLVLKKGGEAVLYEDAEGIWLDRNGDREALSQGGRVELPDFKGHPHERDLKSLHAEILVNLMPSGPVPNLWIYPKPWYRDAAMMLMCLKETGNLHLAEPWVMGLSKVWDRNNEGHAEPDNLGQVLYLFSLYDACTHPMVDKVLAAIPAYRKASYITGMTDYKEHPVYQTKWLKFGLRSMGLDDPYEIPQVYDPYSSLFWWDFLDEHVSGDRFSERTSRLYPYLNWAEAHFYKGPLPAIERTANGSPRTWEGAGAEADYWRLKALSEKGVLPASCASEKIGMPHTWHAAEMFLYLLESQNKH